MDSKFPSLPYQTQKRSLGSKNANGWRTEKVLIVTADSRILVGTLTAADNTTNLVRSPASLCRFEGIWS